MILLLALLLAISAAHASPAERSWQGLVGGAWTPLGRADLAWVEGGQLSGTLVGSQDGLLDPGLALYGGVRHPRLDLLAELGLARISTSQRTWLVEDDPPSRASSSVMGLRLGADLRYRPRAAEAESASIRPYMQGGIHAVVPAARRADEAWTVEEQAAQDDVAAAERGRIGAIGARAGGGAALCWPVGACVGLRGLVELSRSAQAGESSTTASTLLALEPAITFDLAF